MKNIIIILLGLTLLMVLQSCDIKSYHYFRADGTRDIEESAFFFEEAPNDEFENLPENEWVSIREVDKNISAKISDRVFVKVNRGKNGKPQKLSIKADRIKKNEMKYLMGLF